MVERASEVQFKLRLPLMINPGRNPVYGKATISEIRIGGGEPRPFNPPVKAKLPLPGTTQILVDRMISDDQIDSRFVSDYIYIHRARRDHTPGHNYYAIAPIRAASGDPIRHITPALFFRDESETSPYAVYLEVDRIKDELSKHSENLEVLKKAGHVSTESRLSKFKTAKSGCLVFVFDMTVSFYRYFWGECVRLLPTPRLPRPGEDPKYGQVIGIEENWWIEEGDEGKKEEKGPFKRSNLWKALDELNRIMQEKAKQRVLIIGEPGSGKEVFSNAIHFGSVRKIDDAKGLKVMSVAGMKDADLSELLFGRNVEGRILQGLVSEAEGGTLFLDEFDKVESASFYSTLLRVLEADQFVPQSGRVPQEIRDVNWIFAGAFSGKGQSKSTAALPADFWSRLSARIEIQNPLKWTPIVGGRSYAGALFIQFFLREAVDMAGKVNTFCTAETFQARYAQSLFCGSAAWPTMGSHMKELVKRFEEEIQNGVYCRPFGGEQVSGIERPTESWTPVEGTQPPEYWLRPKSPWRKDNGIRPEFGFDSVRSIRQAAKAAFALMKFQAMSDSTFWTDDATVKRKLSKLAGEAADVAARVVKHARPGKEGPSLHGVALAKARLSRWWRETARAFCAGGGGP